ncbi:DUF3445 domain-containing protein [Terrarubrum flagellatum]|uniref:heme-dependent oxidative N-demethylase family protein n=1 Tax=Terrirubrum flagellatum TaxID=2895980 RepID=UPI00314560BD
MEPTPLRYTPYDGSRRPFSIGLEPLDRTRWIEPDALLLDELAQKDQLIAEKRDVVFIERWDTRASQMEVRDALVEYLLAHHSGRFRREADVIVIDDSRRVALGEDAPLIAASKIVQDDLCIMRRESDGWRLVAASLCFPSSWSLREKFDLPMEAIHAHVPGFPGQMGARVSRIFDNLKIDMPVWRLNWSIYSDGELHHPESKSGPRQWTGVGAFAANAFVRVERQTLARMPLSGDILFTIRVYADPVTAFRSHPRGRELASSLSAQLQSLDELQLRYKNLLSDRDRAVAALAALV